MGKATIISNLGNAKYSVEIEYYTAFAENRIDIIDKQLLEYEDNVLPEFESKRDEAHSNYITKKNELDYLIYVGESSIEELSIFTTEVKKAFDLYEVAQREVDKVNLEMLSLEKEKEQYQKWMEKPTVELWCTSYSPEIEVGNEVATAELIGESGTILIKPEGRAHVANDGQLVRTMLQTPAQTYLNASIRPGWQKWQPTYRAGTITALEGDLCDISITDFRSSDQELPINKETILEGVPIEYLWCNGKAFNTGDFVLIEFTGQDWSAPKVVGFMQEPSPCPRFVFAFLHEKPWFGFDSVEKVPPVWDDIYTILYAVLDEDTKVITWLTEEEASQLCSLSTSWSEILYRKWEYYSNTDCYSERYCWGEHLLSPEVQITFALPNGEKATILKTKPAFACWTNKSSDYTIVYSEIYSEQKYYSSDYGAVYYYYTCPELGDWWYKTWGPNYQSEPSGSWNRMLWGCLVSQSFSGVLEMGTVAEEVTQEEIDNNDVVLVDGVYYYRKDADTFYLNFSDSTFTHPETGEEESGPRIPIYYKQQHRILSALLADISLNYPEEEIHCYYVPSKGCYTYYSDGSGDCIGDPPGPQGEIAQITCDEGHYGSFLVLHRTDELIYEGTFTPPVMHEWAFYYEFETGSSVYSYGKITKQGNFSREMTRQASNTDGSTIVNINSVSLGSMLRIGDSVTLTPYDSESNHSGGSCFIAYNKIGEGQVDNIDSFKQMFKVEELITESRITKLALTPTVGTDNLRLVVIENSENDYTVVLQSGSLQQIMAGSSMLYMIWNTMGNIEMPPFEKCLYVVDIAGGEVSNGRGVFASMDDFINGQTVVQDTTFDELASDYEFYMEYATPSESKKFRDRFYFYDLTQDNSFQIANLNTRDSFNLAIDSMKVFGLELSSEEISQISTQIQQKLNEIGSTGRIFAPCGLLNK